MKKIGFIGAGNMAGAIIKGIINENINIVIFDIDKEKYSKYSSCIFAGNEREVFEMSDIIFLAVKPQVFPEVLPKLQGAADENPEKIFVTIAAGITSDYISSFIGRKAKIVRVMPNTPLMVGCGATALSKNENVTESEFEDIVNIFRISGTAVKIDEKKMNEVIAISGSSPAYIYLLAKAVIEKAGEYGFDKNTAKNLICAALTGSAKMIAESNMDCQSLIDMVTSKGGTTFEALRVFYDNKFEDIIKNAMDACTKRAYELEK